MFTHTHTHTHTHTYIHTRTHMTERKKERERTERQRGSTPTRKSIKSASINRTFLRTRSIPIYQSYYHDLEVIDHYSGLVSTEIEIL